MQQQSIPTFVQQQAAMINSQNVPYAYSSTQNVNVSTNSMNMTQGEAKRKRVQVPAACAQCKRAHAACSNTRPCDRCVRINQADACVSSHLASVRPQSQPPETSPQQSRAHSVFESPPPPALAPNNSVPFNENDVSRFLFEDNHDEFPELPQHFSCMEAIKTPDSPCLSSSNSSLTPSPVSTPGQPTPSPQHTYTPPQQAVYSPQFTMTADPVPLASVGPSPAAIAASIAAQVPTVMDATGTYEPQTRPTFMPPHLLEPAMSHTTHPIVSNQPGNMMEVMVSELIQSNKKMENMLMSLNTEMKELKQEMSTMKQASSGPLVNISKSDLVGPATAVWTVNDGMLMEHNHKFAQLLDLMEVPKGYSMQHFFGGPCSKAASSRMQHHLENIKNSQPVTDYAVIERKRVTGEVMRLMIVVNVVPTPTPVFITTMYELSG